MKRILELLRLRKVDTEITRDPFWYVAQDAKGGRVMLAGVWFNRPDAEQHFKDRRYRYPDDAYVYCDAADMESHLKEIYDLEREATLLEELEQNA
jgi:hypothetical protein